MRPTVDPRLKSDALVERVLHHKEPCPPLAPSHDIPHLSPC